MGFVQRLRLPAHNNVSELNLRRQVLGRKNWLFVGSDDGGTVNATFVSLLASARLHDIEPQSYIRDCSASCALGRASACRTSLPAIGSTPSSSPKFSRSSPPTSSVRPFFRCRPELRIAHDIYAVRRSMSVTGEAERIRCFVEVQQLLVLPCQRRNARSRRIERER